MKKTFIVLILTFNFYCINKTYSQQTISLKTVSARGYAFNKHIKIELINNLPDSNNLGFIPSDVVNDRQYIKPSSTVTDWLQNFIDKQFGTNGNGKELLWVIQDLSMGEDSTQSNIFSFVKLKADIYYGSGQNNSTYQLVNTYDSTWIVSNGNADFSQMVGDAFIELYANSVAIKKGAASSRLQQLNNSIAGTKDEIIQQEKTSNNYAVLNTKQYQQGIYLSFNEFKNNTPAITNFYADVNAKNDQVELYQIMPDSSSQLIDSAWGLSINNELYHYAEGQLYPIEQSGNTFYVAKYLKPDARRNQAFYWRKYVGSKQTDNNPYNDAHELRKKVPGAKNVSLEATHLDFDSQDFIY